MTKYCNIGTAQLAYTVIGDGPIEIVIEGSINSCSAEWWEFCQKIENHTILTYDRAGYGKSSISSLPRTPENITIELAQLLKSLKVSEKIVLLGHSQGGLYASLYAINNPTIVKGLILLDPLSYLDNEFKSLLTKKEYNSSGVDKSQSFKLGKIITKLGLGFLLKGLLKKAPPLYYYNFQKESETYILKSLTQHKQYSTALEEYLLSHQEKNLTPFIEKKTKEDYPITLITHSKQKMCDEIEYFGNTTKELAEKIENIWQSIMDSMRVISGKNTKVIAENSSHYIHLTDEKLVVNEIEKFA